MSESAQGRPFAPHALNAPNPLLWPPTFTSAIFDFDGTIADSLYVWEEVDRLFMESRGLPFQERPELLLTLHGFERWAAHLRTRFGLSDDPEDLYREWNEIGAQIYRDEVTLRPGAKEYLQSLAEKGVALALATANDPEVLQAVLEREGLDGLFCARAYGSEVPYPKDHPDIYRLALARLGVDAPGCMVFEDYLPGIVASQSIGLLTCAVGGANKRHDFSLMKRTATTWLDDFEGLRAP